MVDERVLTLEEDITRLRVEQARVEARLDHALQAINALTTSVERLTAAMNRASGEHAGAKAVLFTIGSILGAIAAMVVEWYSVHKS